MHSHKNVRRNGQGDKGKIMKHYTGIFALALALGACSQTEDATVAEANKATEITKMASSKMDTGKIDRNPTKNAYFGDTHVHTRNSFDAFIVGTRSSADDAYRFAQGETIDNGQGDPIKLSGPPLDFYVVTDHGEYMGVIASMRDKGSKISKTKTAKSIFGLGGGSMDKRRESFIKIGTTIVTGEPIEDIYDRDFIDNAWAQNVSAAEQHYKPGTFTTFAGYEFTAMEIIGGIEDNLGALNLHRNVIFENESPERLFTTLDSPNPEKLWDWMNRERAAGRDVLAIPHNSNGSNGQMFDTAMTDGSAFTDAYAKNRILNEPIVEITQIKGTSETHPMLSTSDEFSDFELYDILIGMPVKAKVSEGSFVRSALARGLDFEEKLGTNPYAFGVIGASDTHVSGPSLSEEDHFGKFSRDLEPDVRGSVPPKGAKTWPSDFKIEVDIIAASQYGASGLAGVWAEANTREDIFKSMRSKETFATSGPRIRVRMFAGDYDDSILSASDMVEQAYANGSPMGTDRIGAKTSPDFLAWAMKDPQGQSLQRLQMVKVWNEAGTRKEAIYDIACAGGIAPNTDTKRCPDNGGKVELKTCETEAQTGATELKALWQDPDYNAQQSSSYYIRVLENPKCRWSTWDAVRNGTPPNPNMHATLQDRAWGSPIWVKP